MAKMISHAVLSSHVTFGIHLTKKNYKCLLLKWYKTKRKNKGKEGNIIFVFFKNKTEKSFEKTDKKKDVTF